MGIKKAVGRPPKMSMKIIDKLADSISHNYSISDSCRYARISRTTFYHYLKSEPIFKAQIDNAKVNQNKVIFNFRTYY
jgi:hypothetical protein